MLKRDALIDSQNVLLLFLYYIEKFYYTKRVLIEEQWVENLSTKLSNPFDTYLNSYDIITMAITNLIISKCL